jgi:hypothetical protein
MLEASGYLTRPWELFFRTVAKSIETLGSEKYFQITNNTAVAADVDGLAFTSSTVSQAVVDFLIQRVTTGGGATELITSGTFHAVYKPSSDSWSVVLMGTPGPSASGVTFSITATGQVQYTSTNITGTESISKLTYRARTLGGKSSLYSEVG